MRMLRAGVCACALNAKDAMQPRVLVLFWNQLGGEPVTGCKEAAQGFDGCSIIMQDCGKGPGEELVTGRRAAVCVGALGRGPRELRGFTEAAGRVFTQRALKVVDEARVICPFPHPLAILYR